MTVRERLAKLLTGALEAAELPYRCDRDDLYRGRAGYWQRSAGACSWYALAGHVENAEAKLSILSWDTMTECVRAGIELRRGHLDWEANAKIPANGFT